MELVGGGSDINGATPSSFSVLVLLLASVERFGVSRMRDFFIREKILIICNNSLKSQPSKCVASDTNLILGVILALNIGTASSNQGCSKQNCTTLRKPDFSICIQTTYKCC